VMVGTAQERLCPPYNLPDGEITCAIFGS